MHPLSPRAIRFLQPTLFILFLILLWEILSEVFNVSRFVAPRPSEIFSILNEHYGEVAYHAIQTLATTLVGFLIGITIGFFLGVLLGASARLYDVVFPTLIGVNSIPKVAIAPLIILWAGIGSTSATLTSALIVIFPVTVVVSGAVAKVDPDMRDIMRALGASQFDVMRKVAVPQAMPYFFGSLKIAITLALVGTILAETIAANRGLGFMMNRAASNFDVELVFSGVLSLAAMGIGLYVVSLLLETRAVGWAYKQKAQK